MIMLDLILRCKKFEVVKGYIVFTKTYDDSYLKYRVFKQALQAKFFN